MSEAILSIASLCGVLVLAQLSPGPDFLLIFRTSLAYGWKEGTALGIGISIGFAVQLSLVCLLGSRILEQSWSQYLLIAAGLYLMYLAWMIFPRKKASSAASQVRAADIEQASDAPSIGTMLVRGFFCNILNAKCLMFIVGLTIDSLRSYQQISWYIPALILSLTLMSALGWSMWSGCLQWQPLRKGYRKHAWVIDLFFALILFGIALSMMVGALAS